MTEINSNHTNSNKNSISSKSSDSNNELSSTKQEAQHVPQPASSFQTIDANKEKNDFRNYTDSQRQATVEAFYKLQHTNMTFDHVMKQKKKHLKFDKCVMTIWEMLQYLDQIIDDSDPDTDLSQIEHAIQTAEESRRQFPGDEYDWLHTTAFIHDLGKVISVTDNSKHLCGDAQWTVVGDTFPVGCEYSSKIVFYEYFANNPDFKNPKYNTKFGLYSEKCGLENIHMSFGHDEYMYQIAKHQSLLPKPALYILRYHSFYPWHTGGDYMHLCNEEDIQIGLKWVKMFNSCDLYSKSHECPPLAEVADYYKSKIEKYFPKPVNW